MDLIENDPLNVLDRLSIVVQHRLKNLGRHNEAGSITVQLDVTSNNTHISKFKLEVSVLLIGQ